MRTAAGSAVRVDEPLRAAVRHDRPRLGQQQVEADGGLRPRDVQALIRAGSSAEEVAERSGWSVEKVRRYEGPIVAEREHVAGLSRGVRRASAAAPGPAPRPCRVRVGERLKGRGVDPAGASLGRLARGGRPLDRRRHLRRRRSPAAGVLALRPGRPHRHRRSTTRPAGSARRRSRRPGPIPAPHLSAGPAAAPPSTTSRPRAGVRGRPAAGCGRAARPWRSRPAADVPAARGPEPLDLMTAMRERTTARGRRRGGSRRGPRKAPTNLPGAGDQVPDDAMPLEDMAYDPATMPPPPAAHAHPDVPDPLDARPEPAAAAWAEAAGAALDQPDDAAPAAQAAGSRRRGASPGADPRWRLSTPSERPAAEAETAEVLESVQSLEAPHRAPEPAEEPATAPAAGRVGRVGRRRGRGPRRAPARDPGSRARGPAEPRPRQPVEPAAEAGRAGGGGEAARTSSRSPSRTSSRSPRPRAESRPSRAGAPARRNGRPSVPSWDDIMFGARPGGRS